MEKSAKDNAARPAQTLPAGFMLCRQQYRLGRILGNGGFGITYLAWDNKNNRKAAIKEFFPVHLVARDNRSAYVKVHQELEAEFRHSKMRFQEEAQALYELRNVPEVIDVFHLFEENGTAYYVMELLEGQDLKSFLAANGVMTWAQFQTALGMILRALEAVHKRQMIHRDISPDNIFMMQSGGAKLIDFGNARSYMSASPLTKIMKTHFAPVEQFSDEGKQGPWTDIYSLSVTMYYALSGILPPAATERLIALKTKGNDPIKPLGMLNPSIPPNVAHAIMKGMEVLEDQRYHTIAEFSQQLFPGVPVLERQLTQKMQTQKLPTQKLPTQNQSVQRQQSAQHSRQTSFPMLQCVQGRLKGKQLILRPGVMETVGRDGNVSLVYPADSPGISRHQCSFMVDNKGIIYVRDDNSSYGTSLNNKRMKPMEWYSVKRGDAVCFAKEEYRIL